MEHTHTHLILYGVLVVGLAFLKVCQAYFIAGRSVGRCRWNTKPYGWIRIHIRLRLDSWFIGHTWALT